MKREAICVKPGYWLHKFWDKGESYFAPEGETIQSQEDYAQRKPLGDQIPPWFEWAENLTEIPEPDRNEFSPPPKPKRGRGFHAKA